MRTARWFLALLLLAAVGCSQRPQAESSVATERREAMVRDQLEARGITSRRVLDAMRKVVRDRFVPPEWRELAYSDRPLPIGQGQTISQPWVVARMTEALELRPTDRVLEIGTGSGYQAAVLAELAARVDTIEILPALAENARRVLSELGYDRIRVHTGDGYQGLPDRAPFDAIVLTAAPEKIPPALLDQLADGGRLVAPVGPASGDQRLVRIVRHGTRLDREQLDPVRFVPMAGDAAR